ncbi:MAG: septation protein A [Pseudomonadota bacterium]
MNPVLKMALELGPLIVFFFTNSRGKELAESYPALNALGGPIFIATAAFMVAMAISLILSYAIARKIPVMPLISGVVVFVMGGLTLYLQDDTFIKVKPTIVNVFFGASLFVGLAFGKSLLQYIFDDAFKITDKGWTILTYRWAIFFLFLAVLNEVVWRSFSTDFWVAFKVWGVMPITMVFAVFQMQVVLKHPLEEKPEPAE